MTDPIHQQLLGHLLGALDDDEQAWLDERLEHDEACRLEFALWRRRLARLESMRPDFDPPPGLAGRTCRMVAAYGPAPARSVPPAAAMSPDPMPLGVVSQVSWHDVVMLGVLMLTAVALLFPAIDASRFNSSLSSCRNNLRQFGVAMTQYGDQWGESLAQLAGDGKLTAASVAAADLLDGESAECVERYLYPESWPAAQGPVGDCSLANEIGAIPPSPGSPVPGYSFASTADAWSGTWRDGTTDGRGNCLPAAQALFADYPSVNLPGRRIVGHRGRGRNLFFGDGRVRFIPCSLTDAVSNDPEIYRPATGVASFSNVESTARPDVTVPIIFVNRSGQ